MEKQLNIEVKDSLFDPDLPKSLASVVNVHSLRTGTATPAQGKKYYKVWLYLEGHDLPYLDRVTYTLHRSYTPPTLTLRRTPSNLRCKVAILASGVFKVKATLWDKRGFSRLVTHELSYTQELPTDPDRYINDEDDSSISARPMLASYSS